MGLLDSIMGRAAPRPEPEVNVSPVAETAPEPVVEPEPVPEPVAEAAPEPVSEAEPQQPPIEPAPEPVNAGLATELAGPQMLASAEVVHAVAPPAAPVLVTMYRDTIPVKVPATEIPRFQALGFLLHEPVDLPMLAREIGIIAAEIGPALLRFVDSCARDGTINTADGAELHVVQRCWNEVEQKLEAFMNVAYQNYPVREQR